MEENKIENTEKKKFNKKYLAFGIIGIFAIALVTAGFVIYYSQKQINMAIESPVVFNGETSEDITLIAGDGYRLYLVEGENRLNKTVDVKFKFSLLDGAGIPLANTNGFYLAYSDDIQYAYSDEYGKAQNWAEAQVWMNNNLDWFDWYLTGAYVDYDTSIITNHGGNSVVANAFPFNYAIPEDLEPGKFYAVVYLDIDEAVIPANYKLSIDMMPALA